ncbi:MAG: hypothetical protein IPG55_04995 [Saprospiraceae bacterium]|nr:hypothetical protein [Candidatus Defluviibacterium haderslevense]
MEKERGEINSYVCNTKDNSIKSLTNVLLYDDTKKWLGVPLSCSLPKYYAIAFTLLSGEKPKVQKYNDKEYLIYKNVPFLFCNSLVTTLHQLFEISNRKNNLFQ